MALTADPIASLVDTAFIGQIGIFYYFRSFELSIDNTHQSQSKFAK